MIRIRSRLSPPSNVIELTLSWSPIEITMGPRVLRSWDETSARRRLPSRLINWPVKRQFPAAVGAESHQDPSAAVDLQDNIAEPLLEAVQRGDPTAVAAEIDRVVPRESRSPTWGFAAESPAGRTRIAHVPGQPKVVPSLAARRVTDGDDGRPILRREGSASSRISPRCSFTSKLKSETGRSGKGMLHSELPSS